MSINIVTHPRVNTELHDYLTKVKLARQVQLDSLSSTNLDVVAAAHRGSVERILEELGTALALLAAGTYGTCVRCGDAINTARLELRPWATTCTGCVRR